MLEWVRIVLEHSPLLALFGVIGLGYALGRSRSADSRSASGRAVRRPRRWSYRARRDATRARQLDRPGMFLYGVGIQYGAQFFAACAARCEVNLIGAIGVVAALGIALALGAAIGAPLPHSIGLFAVR